MGTILVALVLTGMLVTALAMVKFRPTLWCYLFLFTPCYELFVEYYVRTYNINDYSFPDSLRLLKDVVWAAVVLGFFLSIATKKRRAPAPQGPSRPLVIAFMVYLTLQALRNVYYLGTFGTLLAARNDILYVPPFFMAAYLLREMADFARLVRYYCYLALALCAGGIIQAVFQIDSRAYLLNGDINLQHNMVSFYEARDHFSLYLCVTLALVLGTYRYLPNRLLFKAVILLSAVCIVASQSRTGLIVMFGVFVMSAVWRTTNFSALLATALAGAKVVQWLVPHIMEEHRIYTGVFSDPRFTETWPALWRNFLQAPIFGQGLGSFGYAALRLRFRGELNVVDIAGVDNYYYCLMLNTGIVGLLFFLSIIVAAAYERKRLFRLVGDHPSKYAVHALSMAVIVCMLFGFEGNALSCLTGAIDFWLLLGALFALRYVLRKPQEVVHPRQSADALRLRRFMTPDRSMAKRWQEVK